MFSYKKFALLCTDRGTYPSTVAVAIGLSNAAATGWKNGKQPREDKIEKIASVLNCTVEELLEDKETPAAPEGDGLTDFERAVIELYRNNPDARAQIDLAVELAKRKAAQKDG